MAIWLVQSQCSASITVVKKKRRKYGLSTHSFNCTRFSFPTSMSSRRRGTEGSLAAKAGIICIRCPESILNSLFQNEYLSLVLSGALRASHIVHLAQGWWSTACNRTCNRTWYVWYGTVQECLLLRKPLWPSKPTSSAPSKSLQFATRRHLPKFVESKHGVGTCFIERVEFAWIIFSTLIWGSVHNLTTLGDSSSNWHSNRGHWRSRGKLLVSSQSGVRQVHMHAGAPVYNSYINWV